MLGVYFYVLELCSAVVPEVARKQVHNWVAHELNSDLSVSRPRSRLTWGIPVPNDPTQTVSHRYECGLSLLKLMLLMLGQYKNLHCSAYCTRLYCFGSI